MGAVRTITDAANGRIVWLDTQRHYAEASCVWYHCRRNTPANRDPGGSPEQQDYVLRVDTHPHSAHFIRGETELGCRIRREGQDWGEIRTKNKLPLS